MSFTRTQGVPMYEIGLGRGWMKGLGTLFVALAFTPCRYYYARSQFLKFLAFRHVQAIKIQAMFRGRMVPRWRVMRDKEMGA